MNAGNMGKEGSLHVPAVTLSNKSVHCLPIVFGTKFISFKIKPQRKKENFIL